MNAQNQTSGPFRLEPVDAALFQELGIAPVRAFKLVFDLPGEKVNKLGKVVLDAFPPVLQELEQRSKEIDLVLLVSGKSKNFVAGADIDLIRSARSASEAEGLSSQGQALLNRLEDLEIPVVSLIEGAALGGGCELALATRAIVMAKGEAAKIGLPEVLLGLLPGMGGTVRLPRKVGLASALDLILTGRQLRAEQAEKIGLVDMALPSEDFFGSALAWSVRNLEQLKARRRLARAPVWGGIGGRAGRLLEESWLGRSIILKKAREGVIAKTRGKYPAALAILEQLGATYQPVGGVLSPSVRSASLSQEAKAFGALAATSVSKHLIGLFFLTEEVKKGSGVAAPQADDLKGSDLPLTVGVLGAGVMGGGVGQLFAEKGASVRLKDVTQAALELGIQSADSLFQKKVKKRRLTPRQASVALNRIAPSLTYVGFEKVELVIEAVVEKMEIKQQVLKQCESVVSVDCVLGTNTSSLSVSEMQKGLAHPERVVGIHFFNPVHKMPLIEVIRGDQTADRAVVLAYRAAKGLGKTPIVVKDSAGFLVNRILGPYLNEAGQLVAEGFSIEGLDEALIDFGMPMGPVELMDEVGIDVADKVSHILSAAFGARLAAPAYLSKMLEAKRLGKKSKKGFYTYSGVQLREKSIDAELYPLLGLSEPADAVLTSEKAAESVDRCVLLMVNEAARCLEEGVVARPDEVDLGMIMGTGFPPFRGGLLRYADELGLPEVLKRLEALEQKYGARFAPSKLVREHAVAGRGFY